MSGQRNEREKIAVLDQDPLRRHRLVKCLNAVACAFPLASVYELLHPVPQDALLFVHDEENSVRHVVEALAEVGEWLPIVAYSEAATPRDVVSALRGGAIDYLDLTARPWSLQQFVRDVRARANEHAGWAEASMTARRKLSQLSAREREIFDAVLSGNSNHCIAARLGISPRTVECHRANALKKIGASNTASAASVFREAEMLRVGFA
tara:strand:+ start:124 stop:747 length:624 start_codon:yes stop_codon:yes gene_type:complete